MVDKSLLISSDGLVHFYTRMIFWSYLFPMFMGFFSVFCIQVYSRVGSLRNIKARTAFLCAGTSAMVNLWGWAHLARTPAMIPFYGCGVGLAAAIMSQVAAIVKQHRTTWKIPILKVIWKANILEVEALKKHMKMAA